MIVAAICSRGFEAALHPALDGIADVSDQEGMTSIIRNSDCFWSFGTETLLLCPSTTADCTSVYKEKATAVGGFYNRFKTLEDLYFGNITPSEQDMTAGLELKRAVDRVARYENQLTGCVSQISEKRWAGDTPGKKHARNVYAHSEAECEKLLTEMIAEVKAEIAAKKERLKAAPKAG